MERKGINRLFLSIIAVHLLVVLLMITTHFLTDIDIITNLFLSESIIIIPGIIYLVIYSVKSKWSIRDLAERLGFKKMKVSSVFMVILFTFMVMPITTLINAVSMLFVDNTVLSMSSDVLSQPFIVMLFVMALFGPFCEEFIFRGIIYRGYRKEGSIFAAVLLSGLLFGLMHLNFNQAGYAFVIGIAMALLVEATGSIFSSILCHFIFNAQSVCMMYLVERFMPGFYANSSVGQYTQEELYVTISVYLVLAAITTAIAVCILSWIAKNEGRTELLKQAIPSKERKGQNLFSIALIVGMVLSIAYMVFEAVLTAFAS